jgi:alkylmercury lyase
MDERKLTALGQLLAERICGTNEAFCMELLRLLGQGQPVSVAQMGAALGISEVAVTETFERMSDIERDERGQVVGLGLSLRTILYQFRINGHTLYTWCALDALTYPILLEQTAQVESICPITQTPIRLHVGPEGISALDPATAMVSLIIPDTDPDACNRASFCDQGHFFASPEAAATWQADHPEARALPVEAVYQLGRIIAARRHHLSTQQSPAAHTQ